MRKSVCVIGAGLAGGIVASTLAARGYPVTLVEAGDVPRPLLPGDEVWDLPLKAPFTRGSGLGGTSNFWHGGLTVLDKIDVEGITVEGNGPRMPIVYSQLRDYYGQAVALMRGDRSYSLADIEAPPESPMEGFESGGRAFRLKALLYPKRPFCSRSLIRWAQERHGLRVVPNVAVRRVAGSKSWHVAYGEGVDVRTGAPRRFPADVFVLSAGGLGSPKILLQSTRDCLALDELPIGKFVIDHPSGFVFKAKLKQRMDLTPLFGLRRKGYQLRYGFALPQDHLSAPDSRNHILYLRPATSLKDPSTYDALKRKLVSYRGRTLSVSDMAYLMRHADLLFDAVNFRYGLSYSTRYVSGLVFAEQLPEENRQIAQIEDGKFSIKWAISPLDCRSVEKFIRIFLESYSAQFESFMLLPDMGKGLDSAGHHSGSCRMSLNASGGVVNADLRVHTIDNLHVVDGSVIPYSGHANTGLTIAALALKCCDAVSNA